MEIARRVANANQNNHNQLSTEVSTTQRRDRKERTAADSALGFYLPEHHYPLVWLLVTTIAAFAMYVAWDLGLLRTIVTLDRSYIASVIGVLVLIASGHAAWHIFLYSQRIETSREVLESAATSLDHPVFEEPFLEEPFLKVFVADLEVAKKLMDNQTTTDNAESDSVIEIYADRLRSPVDLGWFLVDLAVRLGLVGTIIGFILIFTSLSGISIDGADGLKELLVTMSGGMGTALFTTLSGLVGATFLSLQYLILGRQAETLIGLLVRLRNRYNSAPD